MTCRPDPESEALARAYRKVLNGILDAHNLTDPTYRLVIMKKADAQKIADRMKRLEAEAAAAKSRVAELESQLADYAEGDAILSPLADGTDPTPLPDTGDGEPELPAEPAAPVSLVDSLG